MAFQPAALQGNSLVAILNAAVGRKCPLYKAKRERVHGFVFGAKRAGGRWFDAIAKLLAQTFRRPTMKSSVLALFAAAAFSLGSMSLVQAQDAAATPSDAAITGCPADASMTGMDTAVEAPEALSDADATGEDDGSSTSDTADASNCCPTVAEGSSTTAEGVAAAENCPVSTEEETVSEDSTN